MRGAKDEPLGHGLIAKKERLDLNRHIFRYGLFVLLSGTLGGCCGGKAPPLGTDLYDPSSDVPIRFGYPIAGGLDFEQMQYWKAENGADWPSHADGISLVPSPDFSVDGLAFKLSFSNLGLCEGDGCKTEAAWSFRDVPMNFSGKTKVSMYLTYEGDVAISIKLSLSTGENWDWNDFPKPPATIAGFVRQLVEFDIPPTIPKLDDNKRFCILIDKSGEPYVSGALYIDRLQFE